MEKRINISFEADEACEEPQVVIRGRKDDPMIEKMITAIEQCVRDDDPRLTVYSGDMACFINRRDIIRAYTENRRLVVCTPKGSFESKLSLKELEEILCDDFFVRISRFEIVNLQWVSSFDLSITGTIRLIFENENETWVARRYVRAISEKLSLKKKGGEGHE